MEVGDDQATHKIIHNSTTTGGGGSSRGKRRKINEAVDPAITAAIARDPAMALTAEERTWALVVSFLRVYEEGSSSDVLVDTYL